MALLARWRLRAVLGLTLLMLTLGLIKRLDPLQQGLAGQYFFTLDPNSTPVHTVVDAPPSTERLEAAWNPPVPQVFSATWHGALLVLRDDFYTFATASDDGSHLYVDGHLIVDNGESHAARRKSGSVQLNRGVHTFFIDYSQQGGAYHLDLLWSRGGRSLEPLAPWILATHRVGLARFVASLTVWRALALVEWIWWAALLLIAGSLALDALLPLRRTLEREGTWSVFRWILLGSTALNVTGIWWGLPGNWVPIELTPKTVFDGLAQHFSHGWFDAYPPFHFYVLSAAVSPLLLLHQLGRLDLSGDAGYILLVLTCRLVSVVFAAGIVTSAVLVGTRTFGRRAGLFGAAILSIVAPFLYYAKTANTDVPYLFWFAVAMVLYLRVLEHLRTRDFILFAVAATLSVCTKDQAYGLFLLMPVPILYEIWQANRQSRVVNPMLRAWIDHRLLIAAVVSGTLFAICHNLLFNLQGFRDHVRFIIGPGSANYQVFEATPAGRAQLLQLTAQLIQQAFGWPFAVATVVGFVIAFTNPSLRRAAIFLLVPAVSYYLGFINVILYTYDRFVLPICFVMALFAGLAVDRLWSWRKPELGRWPSVVAGVAFVYTILYAATVDVLMVRDSRYAAQRWLADHVREGDRVGSIFDAEYLPRLEAFHSIVVDNVAELQRQRPEFYVLNADYARAVDPESRSGELLTGLEGGSLGYQRVFRFRSPSPWPWLVAAHHDLTGPRHETRVFGILRNINPMIEIFQRDGK